MRRDILRGLHFQRPPSAGTKRVRCVLGRIWDVFVDMRAGAPSYGTWGAVEEELAKRRAAWKQKPMIYPRGYGQMFAKHVTQADQGCDFDFLEGAARIPEPEIH